MNALPKQIEDSNPENESQDRATGDRLRVTGSGALYVENVDDFLASKRMAGLLAIFTALDRFFLN